MRYEDAVQRLKALPCWRGAVTLAALEGGITNRNFHATDANGAYAVRVGADIPEHHVMRFNELAAMRAAHAAGIAPALIYAEPQVTVLAFIESRTLTRADVCAPEMLPRIVDLVKRFHRDMPLHLRGPALIFWPFHIIRDYAATLAERGSPHATLARDLAASGRMLEAAAGPFDIIYGHNDLLAANLLDDGSRLWLIDYDYAGFGSPLFDLGGLAVNNGLSHRQEEQMLEQYFETAVTGALQHRYHAMKCAAVLRETMWSMVSEITSDLDFDFAGYTAENLGRFRAVHDDFTNT